MNFCHYPVCDGGPSTGWCHADCAKEQAIRSDERVRCAKLICTDCAGGMVPTKGFHVLEVIQGHVAHERKCPAHNIWLVSCPKEIE